MLSFCDIKIHFVNREGGSLNDPVPGMLNIPSTLWKVGVFAMVGGHALSWLTGISGIALSIDGFCLTTMILSQLFAPWLRKWFYPSGSAAFLERDESYEWDCLKNPSVVAKFLELDDGFVVGDHYMTSYCNVLKSCFQKLKGQV